jgi:hypothetical protein
MIAPRVLLFEGNATPHELNCRLLPCPVRFTQTVPHSHLLDRSVPRQPLTEGCVLPNMTLTWTIIVSWVAVQLPLAIFVGKVIKCGMEEPTRRARAARRIAIAPS